MKKLKVILIGAGDRGMRYTDIMKSMPDKYELIAVAEPKEGRREYIKALHGLPPERCFESWEPLLALGKIADLAIIATMDKGHFEPTLAAIDAGYDILLEKPIAPTAKECKTVLDRASKRGVKVVICTVLRYSMMFLKIKNLIDDGKIGRIMDINHEECVGNIHQSHSFVRGNWGNEGKSSFMLLQKSCHDLDIIQWLIGKKCTKIQSFGTLTYFTKENAPEGSPDYCFDKCPVSDTCRFNAMKLYYDDKDNSWFRGACTKMPNPTDEQVMEALRSTQYGKCVFKCDNDVVDHQTVNMQFEDGTTATFTMNCFNKGGRYIHVMGTRGEIRASLSADQPIEIYNFDTKETELLPVAGKDGVTFGHGGGDEGLIAELYDYLTGNYNGKSIPEIEDSVYSHLLVFAAEKSRKENIVVDVNDFIGQLDI